MFVPLGHPDTHHLMISFNALSVPILIAHNRSLIISPHVDTRKFQDVHKIASFYVHELFFNFEGSHLPVVDFLHFCFKTLVSSRLDDALFSFARNSRILQSLISLHRFCS